MSEPTTSPENQTITDFITRWKASGAAERANYQLFLTELADLIDVEHPHPKRPVESENSYVFEKAIPTPGSTTNFIDLYKRVCFVLEAKQGSDKVEKGAKPLSAAALKRTTTRKKRPRPIITIT